MNKIQKTSETDIKIVLSGWQETMHILRMAQDLLTLAQEGYMSGSMKDVFRQGHKECLQIIREHLEELECEE